MDFLVIGAQKPGTSWLHHNLLEHPDIWVPPRKELHYFDRDLRYPSPSFLATKSLSGRLLGRQEHNQHWRSICSKAFRNAIKHREWAKIAWFCRFFGGHYGDDWYLSLSKGRPEKLCGEVTPAYSILDRDDVIKIKSLLPKIKIVFILRNPVDRAWSQIKYYEKRGRIDFNNELEKYLDLIESDRQALRSDYFRTMEIWESVFEREAIHYSFYDQVQNAPCDFLKDTFEFLGVEPVFDDKTLQKRFNVSKDMEIPNSVKIYLIKKYSYDIKRLESRFSTDLSHWLS